MAGFTGAFRRMENGAYPILPLGGTECLGLPFRGIAHKAYDADERVRKILAKKGIEAVIPFKSNRSRQRKCDEKLYNIRHLIENFFQQLKQFRAIATRYDFFGLTQADTEGV